MTAAAAEQVSSALAAAHTDDLDEQIVLRVGSLIVAAATRGISCSEFVDWEPEERAMVAAIVSTVYAARAPRASLRLLRALDSRVDP